MTNKLTDLLSNRLFEFIEPTGSSESCLKQAQASDRRTGIWILGTETKSPHLLKNFHHLLNCKRWKFFYEYRR